MITLDKNEKRLLLRMLVYESHYLSAFKGVPYKEKDLSTAVFLMGKIKQDLKNKKDGR